MLARPFPAGESSADDVGVGMLGTVGGSDGEEESMLARTSRCNIEKRFESFVEKGRCPRCFLSKTCCICAPVQALWAPVKPLLKTRIAIYYHYKEFGRASNTAKLCSIGLSSGEAVEGGSGDCGDGDGQEGEGSMAGLARAARINSNRHLQGEDAVSAAQCSYFIYGNPTHEAALNRLLTMSPACVLFASGRSVDIGSLARRVGPSGDGGGGIENSSSSGGGGGSDGGSGGSRVVCVLDGTWGQVSAMEKTLDPSIPRAKVDLLVNKKSDFLSRKQSENTRRISTIEALGLALEGLGEDSPEALRLTAEAIERSLQLGVDALLKQGGRREAFQNSIRPSFSTVLPGERGPYTAPSIGKPTVCPACGAAPKRGFRNCGVRRPYDVERDCPGGAVLRVWLCHECSAYHSVGIDPPTPPAVMQSSGEGREGRE